MQRSTSKILTTHVGSLPFLSLEKGIGSGDETHLKDDVAAVVAQQRSIGVDIVNEGEYAKGGDWLRYMQNRFGGFTEIDAPEGKPLVEQGKDREDFAEFYRYASERGTLFFTPGAQIAKKRPVHACTGPVTYVGQVELKKEIDVTIAAAGKDNVFLTSTAPGSLEVYRRNRHYKNDEEYVFALAEAMRVEYEAIADAGLILQVDDAWLPALWDRIGIAMGIDAFRARSEMRIAALNHALRNIPEDRVRYHLCWGSWHGPHAYDLEFERIADIVLKVKAQAFLIEGANARHEHEYAVWEKIKLPEDKILIPGVVTHSTDVIEHPELVSQRLQRYARLVGKENVIAGTDCGFGGRSHPQIAWAKLAAMVEGAALASKALGFK
ncbi:MAG TPA: cobalamin-independent methionine synthase II family protein [Xanthobacteraceae bacterium]|jgi:5-methyltetrahydropteroyltriglutamate--homocysteine methyltransferase|nr:cobalamin-independent methionine synthase II family protein [Xanthobacteraceae bacterium]